jgi:leader peptidase (prepilin peptidase)/N-methyltransferase
VHRLPDLLTATAFTGTLVLLTAAALAGHLARAAIGAAALACFYLLLWLIRPGEMGLGGAKIAASIGLMLGWAGWQALVIGTFAGFAMAAVYGGVLLAVHRATPDQPAAARAFYPSWRTRGYRHLTTVESHLA